VLLAAAVGRARALGAHRLLLEVREDNAGARAFYDAAGFAELGVRPRYYGDGAAAVVLERVLADGPDHDDDAV
jgi:ribosomal-protein-alanine N-acetyltransferase